MLGLFRSLAKKWQSPRLQPKRATIHRPVYLSFDTLEERLTPATRTWTGGGANTLWSNSANWGGVAVAANDDLVFTSTGSGTITTVNDLAENFAINSITFLNNGGSRNYIINGNTDANSDTIFVRAVVSAPTNLTNTINIPLVVNSVTTVNASTRARASNVATITTSAAHNLVVGQEVTIALTNDTSFNGTFVVTSIPVGSTTTFSYANNGSNVSGTATGTVTPVQTFSSLTNDGIHALMFTGTVSLTNRALTFQGAGSMYLNGQISGGGTGGRLIRNGSGTTYLGANNPTLIGGTSGADAITINDGIVVADADGALGRTQNDLGGVRVFDTVGVGGSVAIATGLAYTQPTILRLNGNGVLGQGALFTALGASLTNVVLDLDSNTTIGSYGDFTITGGLDLDFTLTAFLQLDGTITLNCTPWDDDQGSGGGLASSAAAGVTGTLTVNTNNNLYQGIVTVGASTTLIWNAPAAPAGMTTVSTGGTAIVEGTIGAMTVNSGGTATVNTNGDAGALTISGVATVNGNAGNVTVNTGGTLAGHNGTVGAVIASGTVSPGDNGGASIGILTAASVDFDTAQDGTLLVQVTGTTLNFQFDQLVVTGNVDIGGGAKLTVDLLGLSSSGTNTRNADVIDYDSRTSTYSGGDIAYLNPGGYATPPLPTVTHSTPAGNPGVVRVTFAKVGAAGANSTSPALSPAATESPLTPVEVTQVTPNLSNRILTVRGTRRDDTILLTTSSGRIYVNGQGGYLASAIDQIVIVAEQGDDRVLVAAGIRNPTRIFGGIGNDLLFGGGGYDEIYGGAGNDWMFGNGGSDTLWGEAGSDSLNGGAGVNQLFQDSPARVDSADAIENELIELVNQARADQGLPRLTVSSLLNESARLHSVNMANHSASLGALGALQHALLGANLPTPSSRLDYVGYNWTAWGENVAFGPQTAQEVFDLWMNSPSHRAEILSASFTEIGVAYFDTANGTRFWTQVFGSQP